jgi:hypothetical protein
MYSSTAGCWQLPGCSMRVRPCQVFAVHACVAPNVCFSGWHPCKTLTATNDTMPEPVMLQLLEELNDEDTHVAVLCERAFLAALDGSCRTPIAGHAVRHPQTGKLSFSGLIATTDGKDVKRGAGEAEFSRAAAVELGTRIGTEVKASCPANFFDWEEAQKGLRAPIQEKANA